MLSLWLREGWVLLIAISQWKTLRNTAFMWLAQERPAGFEPRPVRLLATQWLSWVTPCYRASSVLDM